MNVFHQVSRFSASRGFSLLTLAFLSACGPVGAQTAPAPAPASASASEEEGGTLQVSGQGQVQLPAEVVIISFGVETEAETAGEASALNAQRMEEVIRALRSQGGSALEVETFGYNLAPEYRRPTQDDPTGRTISSYRVGNNIRVTLNRIERSGEILDAGISAGANRVMGIQFSAVDTRAAGLEALRKAVEAAREEAQTIAEAMGVRLGPALEVRGGANPPPGPIQFRNMAAAEVAMARTPIEAGDETVTANVTIIYRILEPSR